MKLLKLFKYKEQAHVLMDLLHDKGIRFEERKLSPVEIFVSEDDFESAFEIMRSNERLIEASSVTTAPDEITAQIIKSSLESENIPTLLKGIAIPYGEPIIFGQGGLVPMEILVPGSYVQTAKALLETSAAHPEEQNGEAREENRTHTIEEDTEKKEEE